MKVVLVEGSVAAPATYTGSDDELVTLVQNEASSAIAGQLVAASGETLRVLAVEGIEVTNG